MAKLIINADDYGIHPDIDAGILQSIDHGCINSVSVAAAMVAKDSIAELKKRNVSIGLHVMLVDVPWNTSHYFFKSWVQLFSSMLFKRTPSMDEIETEIRFQMDRMNDLDLTISHIDSHQHTHALHPIWKLCKRLAIENKVPRIRNPHVPSLKSLTFDVGSLGLYALTLMNSTKGIYTVPCIGIPSANDKGGGLDAILSQLTQHQHIDLELVLHPAITSDDLTQKFGHWGISWENQMAIASSNRLRSRALKNM